MRTSTPVRGAALLAAATLALTLGNSPASAGDSQSAAARPTDTAARAHGNAVAAKAHFRSVKPGASEVPDVTKITASSTVLFQPDGSRIGVELEETGDPATFDHIDLTLSVNGGPETTYLWSYDAASDSDFINIPNSVGAGNAKITSATIYYKDASEPTVDTTESNIFHIRRDTKSTANPAFLVSRHNNHISFHAYKWKVFKPSTGLYVPMSSIKLQYRKDHKWHTWQTIHLDSVHGSGSYSTSTSTKRDYRLYYATTDSVLGTGTTTVHHI